MKAVNILIAASTIALATDPRGLKPRPTPADYPAHETSNGLTIGAAALPPSQVKSTFSTDLREYLVLEVAMYPEPGQPLEVFTPDFALRIGAQGELLRAANPHAIAASNQRKNSPKPSHPGDVTIYPSATIGYESGRGYDPVTGRQRTGGVYTETGVGVGIGDQGGVQAPRPGSTDRDRDVMGQELTDKMLPEGRTTDPVAGYLYFRLPARARTSALELQYFAAGGKVRVLLPALRK
jgi:hypothetical protein